MFERNKVDSVLTNAVPIEITTDGGEVLGGRLLIAAGRTLVEVLNGPGAFIEFEPWGGEAVLVAKSSLRTIKIIQIAKAENLNARVLAAESFDPYSVLGVPPGVGFEEVKNAWHRLSKAYHPDRYASAELPQEVVGYLSAMARRINAAYAALETTLVGSRRAVAMRSAPIFTSPPRA